MLVFQFISFPRRCNQAKQIYSRLFSNSNSSRSTGSHACQVFDGLHNPDVFSWACAIRSSSQQGRFKEAASLYAGMQRSGLRPNTFAISAALKACARIPAKSAGISIHAQVYKFGQECDVYVQTCLVDFYVKLGDMGIAQRVFDGMPERNVVSWNSILSGYLKAGELGTARRIFDEIPAKDVVSWNSMVSGYAKARDMGRAESLFEKMPQTNAASWNGMIGGYIHCGNIEAARKLFDDMPERSNVSWITMISGYSKCGDVDSARWLFDQMSAKDLPAWNAMIACYAQNSRPKEALQLFNKMRKLNVNMRPDEMTFVCVISACSQLGDLRFGSWIESYMQRIRIELDDHLKTALIDLYAKCGSMDKAYELFCGLRTRDLVAYSAMIFGCGINGKAVDAIRLFEEMVDDKISPNAITFTGLLTAYNHAGLVEEGCRCFASMLGKHRVAPSADHYAIMVDLLGRAGKLEEARGLIRSMPMQPHVGVWGALLLACRIHCNVDIGEIAAQHCIELETEAEASGYYVLLANIYASAGRWDDAKRLRKVIEEKGLSKLPGCSWMDAT
ncbi:pentatricopeptide repeat-containing protein At4g22760 [Magnolia sinica]|uniref:pentatricopeptide repeat-containing protein At4g22760 n=1 Tax=Magnolia sinica TaxID=86752 RepID=UPI00265B385E|nr:pentatricopeptide repeat-containing protein At4g22760 [Magnolia sinica]